MRHLTITYCIDVEVSVPDDFPLGADEIRKIADWKANDYMDGRHPFATEQMNAAAQTSAAHHIEDTLFQHYCRKVEKWFGRNPMYQHDHLESRNLLIAKWHKTVGFFRSYGARIAVRDETDAQIRERKDREYREWSEGVH